MFKGQPELLWIRIFILNKVTDAVCCYNTFLFKDSENARFEGGGRSMYLCTSLIFLHSSQKQ